MSLVYFTSVKSVMLMAPYTAEALGGEPWRSARGDVPSVFTHTDAISCSVTGTPRPLALLTTHDDVAPGPFRGVEDQTRSLGCY